MHIHAIQHRRAQAQAARLSAALKSPVIPTSFEEVEMQEHLCLLAFEKFHATPDHWNNLAECRNVLIFGATHKREEAKKVGQEWDKWQEIIDLCYRVKAAMLDIAERENKIGRLGLNAEQRELISACVLASADFWKQQPAWLFRSCVSAVRRLNTKTIYPKGQHK